MANPKKVDGNESALKAPSFWPVFLAALFDVTFSRLVRRGRTAQEAAADARDVITEIAMYLGGRQIYLPRGAKLKNAIRDREIYSRLGKERADDLAAEYRVIASRIYQIAREQRKMARAQRDAEADS